MRLLFPDELSPGNSGRAGHKATRHLPSTPLYLTLKEFRVTVKSDTSLSPTGSNVFADQGCVVTAQVGAIQSWESLTKRLFEHWLNISQSYKKQHGGNKRGSRNQILYTAGTFRFLFFFPLLFGGFLSLVPVPINCAGLVYKDISDPNANHRSNVDHKTIVSKELHE